MRWLGVVVAGMLLFKARAAAQDTPTDVTAPHHGHIRVLEPFVGRWVYEGPLKREIPGYQEQKSSLRVEMVYRWAADKNAVVLSTSIRSAEGREYTVVKLIGWDVRRQRIVSAAFNSEGGMSSSIMSVDGNRLISKTRDVAGDGKDATATVIQELLDPHTLVWSEEDRVTQGEKRPASPRYTFRREPSLEP